MTRTNIPIRFRFLSIPTSWEIRTVKGAAGRTARFAFPTYAEELPERELDAWKCRDEFLGLAENDESLLRFLNKIGLFRQRDDMGELKGHWSNEVMQHYREGNPVPIDVRGLWRFRDALKRRLVDSKKFLAHGFPSEINFDVHFELKSMAAGRVSRSAAAGIVTVTDAYRMLLATVCVDIANGLRFKICQRPDCAKAFPLESNHRKKFCSWDCAHITTVRRNRARKGAREEG